MRGLSLWSILIFLADLFIRGCQMQLRACAISRSLYNNLCCAYKGLTSHVRHLARIGKREGGGGRGRKGRAHSSDAAENHKSHSPYVGLSRGLALTPPNN